MSGGSKGWSQRDQQERALFFVKLGGLSADGFIAVYGVVMLITGHQLARRDLQ